MQYPFGHKNTELNVTDLANQIPEEILKQLIVKDYKNDLYQILFFQTSIIDSDCYTDLG